MVRRVLSDVGLHVFGAQTVRMHFRSGLQLYLAILEHLKPPFREKKYPEVPQSTQKYQEGLVWSGLDQY